MRLKFFGTVTCASDIRVHTIFILFLSSCFVPTTYLIEYGRLLKTYTFSLLSMDCLRTDNLIIIITPPPSKKKKTLKQQTTTTTTTTKQQQQTDKVMMAFIIRYFYRLLFLNTHSAFQTYITIKRV